ncbi:MAG: putative Ig domain-containing protein, partial [Caldilineaceae bacterium]
AAVTVQVQSSDDTAAAPTDYAAVNRTVTIPAGATQAAVTVPISDDNVIEPAKRFDLTISAPVGGALGPITTTSVSINDNDTTLALAKTANTAAVDEGGTVTYTVVVANTGGNPATDVTITDDMAGALASGLTLAVGETVTYTYAMTTDDGPQTTVNTVAVTSALTTLITDSVAVTVRNVAPTASLVNSGAVNRGGTAVVSFNGQLDPSGADTAAGLRYSYDFDNDGVFEISDVISASVTVPASFLGSVGGRAVRARIADKDGGFNDYTTIIQVNAPTATPTPTATPSATPTQVAASTPTATSSATPTQAASATPTAASTATPTQIASATPTATSSATPTATSSATPTVTPSSTSTPTPSATPTAMPTATPTATPTDNVGGSGSPPVLTSPGDQESTKGDTVTLPIQAQDNDGDALTFSAKNLPPGLSIHEDSGVISGTLTEEGNFTVTVTVTGGGDAESVEFLWRVLSRTEDAYRLHLPWIVREASP